MNRTYLKKVFWPDLGVGSGFQILEIPAYVCGLKPEPAYILDQNPFFEIGSNQKIVALIRFKLIMLILAVMMAFTAPAQAAPGSAYPQTVDALTALYDRGAGAWKQYKTFELRAIREGQDEMAALFAALAASQLVTVDNIRALLVDLESVSFACPDGQDKVGTTKENLRSAIEGEMRKAEAVYPAAMQRIAAEGHHEAVRLLQTAMDVQNHHLKKLERIYAYSANFFGLLTSRFKEAQPDYFICRITGGIVLDRIPAICPIRGIPSGTYAGVSEYHLRKLARTCGVNARIPVSRRS